MKLSNENIHEIDKFLTPIESIIFMMRYGFKGPKRTIKQCAHLFEVSNTRICHIEKNTFKKLTHCKVPDFIKNFMRETRDIKYQKGLKAIRKNGK